ncbi:MAG: peptide chain release factor N(5)-glutamine methyltransferase [Simkaniaceae bacterium]|nr:peptide chain release factor N(5)-glutamine methyltransferase [Simkaniaceae bacterium]
MHNIFSLLQSGAHLLREARVVDPFGSAGELLAHILRKRRSLLFVIGDTKVDDASSAKYFALIRRRAKREPLDYLLGSKEFLGCRIVLSEAVFIPRQETELLTHYALREIPDGDRSLWDLCTGTGCIGLGIKKARPKLRITLSDLSREALSSAEENGRINGLSVLFRQGDLLTPFHGLKADFITCNPPYVADEEYPLSEPEVLYEPASALVAGKTGLEFYERLARELPPLLNPGARLFLEIGHTQGEAVSSLFSDTHWTDRKILNDFSGKSRFCFVTYETHA